MYMFSLLFCFDIVAIPFAHAVRLRASGSVGGDVSAGDVGATPEDPNTLSPTAAAAQGEHKGAHVAVNRGRHSPTWRRQGNDTTGATTDFTRSSAPSTAFLDEAEEQVQQDFDFPASLSPFSSRQLEAIAAGNPLGDGVETLHDPAFSLRFFEGRMEQWLQQREDEDQERKARRRMGQRGVFTASGDAGRAYEDVSTAEAGESAAPTTAGTSRKYSPTTIRSPIPWIVSSAFSPQVSMSDEVVASLREKDPEFLSFLESEVRSIEAEIAMHLVRRLRSPSMMTSTDGEEKSVESDWGGLALSREVSPWSGGASGAALLGNADNGTVGLHSHPALLGNADNGAVGLHSTQAITKPDIFKGSSDTGAEVEAAHLVQGGIVTIEDEASSTTRTTRPENEVLQARVEGSTIPTEEATPTLTAALFESNTVTTNVEDSSFYQSDGEDDAEISGGSHQHGGHTDEEDPRSRTREAIQPLRTIRATSRTSEESLDAREERLFQDLLTRRVIGIAQLAAQNVAWRHGDRDPLFAPWAYDLADHYIEAAIWTTSAEDLDLHEDLA
ncbi:unnamed protein product [Amoebophrya sp. A25]|nr:unnamed protein product [Amoebophrya sp. A25]|eukprot:GSA25T00006869001.1